ATLDAKDMFFMIPLREEAKPQFAFTWEGTQYTFNQLLLGYKHFPGIAHNASASLLDTVGVPPGVHIYQYVDDILVSGDSKDKVGQVAGAIWNLLTKNGLDIPPSKCQGPGQEDKFLGANWIAGATAVPDNTLLAIDRITAPNNKTELQQRIGTLGYWRKRILGLLVIAYPLYDLL
ncbi:POL3 protein, partial [Ciconia maguari]|nr:POL3 protein [Ciconia maguari]